MNSSMKTRRFIVQVGIPGLLTSALVVAPCLGQVQTPSYTISTYAGNGTAGFSGDAGAAASAQINFAMGLAVDSAGNLYIADQLNARVRKVTRDGVIQTIAGTGTLAHSGDGGTALNGGLGYPCGVTVDSAGNYYIAETAANIVRKVSTTGTITTYAGNGGQGYVGDGGKATDAALNGPLGLLVDPAGNLYISELANNVVRKVTPDGTISTFAGNGTGSYFGDGGPASNAGLNMPEGLAIDAAGNIYIGDTLNHRVRKVTPDGTITTVAGNSSTRGFAGDGGPAVNATLNYPYGVAVDKSGNLYIADLGNNRVRMVTTNGVIRTIAGNGKFGDQGDGGSATAAQLRFPRDVAVDGNGNVYVSDSQNNRIRLLTPVQPLNKNLPLISSTDVIQAGQEQWIEIYGLDLAETVGQPTAADFHSPAPPTSLVGTRVSVGGQPAFLSYVSPNQVNARVPITVGGGTQEVTVTTTAGTSDPYFIRTEGQ